MLPDRIVTELQSTLIVGSPAVAGLWIANTLYDHHVPHYLSRKAGHAAAGFTFLAGILLLSSALWAIALAALFGVLLLGARFLRPTTFRGVGGSGRSNAFSEVWFAWVVIPVIGIGWFWLDRPFITLACLLYMAWGDCITGLVRANIYRQPVKGLWGSAAMAGVCLGISWFLLRPVWVGVLGALTATAAEWAFGDVGIFRWGDDNWAVPLFSLAAILVALALTGNL